MKIEQALVVNGEVYKLGENILLKVLVQNETLQMKGYIRNFVTSDMLTFALDNGQTLRIYFDEIIGIKKVN